MFLRLFITILILLAALVPVRVQADVIAQQLNAGPITVSNDSGGTLQPVTNLPFNKFNPSLGTLTSVTWTLSDDQVYSYKAVGGPQYFDPESGEMLDSNGAISWSDTGSVSGSPSFSG